MPQRPPFEALFRTSPNAYLLLDRELTILDANEAYLKLTGRQLEDIVGRRIHDAFAVDPQAPETTHVEELLESFARVLRTGAVDTLPIIRYSIAVSAGNGAAYEDRYWSATHSPLLDEQGEVTAILQHTMDITELQSLKASQRSAESWGQPLQQLEAAIMSRAGLIQDEGNQLRQLFAQAPGFVCFLRGPEHVYELVNEAYQQLTGNRQLIGKRVNDGLPELAEQGFIDLLDQVYRTGEPYRGAGLRTLLQRRPDAEPEEVYLDLVFQPIIGRDGRTSGIFVQGSDVTEQHRSQQELREHREHLEDLVRERTRELLHSESERRVAEAALMQAQKLEAVGKLTGGIAHDFNNMLQIIGGNLQLLRRNLSGDETAQRRLESAVGGVEKGARLASQLLAFASRQPLQPQSIDLGELLEQMSELLSGALGRAVQVKVDIQSDLWSIFADVGNLQAAILNLAVNARDAMVGGGALYIQLRNRSLGAAQLADQPGVAAGAYVELSVIDEGEGMRPEVLARAFEPFFTTRQDANASGLGLSMVYGFVRQSGGFVVLEGEERKGTTVRVYLPRAAAEGFEGGESGGERERNPASASSVGMAEATPEQAAGLNILFVEDDPTLRMLTGEVMEELGHQVSPCESAEAALEMLEQRRFDVLLTDVGLAGMSGIELVRQARSRDAALSIVIASGYAINAREEGLDNLRTMLKPYDIHQVRTLLDSIRAERMSVARG
ncbi:MULTISPECIES: PAS domain-containing protein [Pseudomonadaceae]|uniref:PAS domain-containing protein n=1 Tax=Pseudomonadaceae TaxID=135621 RepID=UPI0015E49513|nr:MULTISPECIES: PAS domain-containing protein [Pseudomonadaceae]MBA1276781.1 PAS domain-containing protein [Stutzerimonas stutzeri]MBC8651423.1 PAS domain-containing protein [Pseudomonas sp. MT4]QXY93230.1 PAS domain-containing protein [Pseudomonas sp. MTM4]